MKWTVGGRLKPNAHSLLLASPPGALTQPSRNPGLRLFVFVS